MKTRKYKRKVRKVKKTMNKKGGGGGTDRISYAVSNQTIKIKLKDKQKVNFNSTYLNFMDTNTRLNFKFQIGGTSKLEENKNFKIPGMNKITQLIKQIIFNRSLSYMEISQRD